MLAKKNGSFLLSRSREVTFKEKSPFSHDELELSPNLSQSPAHGLFPSFAHVVFST